MRTLSFWLTFTLLVLTPSIVSAHTLKTDGSIGAVLHLDPEDDPIVGEPSYLFFEFKDKEKKFNPSECNCTVIITEGGKQIDAESLFQNNPNPNLTNSSFTYSFPKKDIYEVKIVGQPLTVGAFQPFSLAYDIRVARESKKRSLALPSIHIFHLSFAIIAAIFVLAVGIKQKIVHK